MRLCDSRPTTRAGIDHYAERIGEHWVWREGAPVNQTTGYPRLKMKSGKYEYVHILWWEQVNGPQPSGRERRAADDQPRGAIFGKRCVWPGCKSLLTHGENSEDRHERTRGE